MSHDEMIAVIAAHRDGASIEWRHKGSDIWRITQAPKWDFQQFEYRIKPEPLVLWAIHHGKDMVVCSDNESYVNREFEKTEEFKGYTLKKFVEVME